MDLTRKRKEGLGGEGREKKNNCIIIDYGKVLLGGGELGGKTQSLYVGDEISEFLRQWEARKEKKGEE